MRRNVYESAVIINATLDDVQIESVINKIKDYIEQNDGQILDLDKWGRKRLAYVIKKNKVGFYAIYRFEAQADFILKLERVLRLDESVIRFLTIKLSKKALEHFKEHKTSIPDEKILTPEIEEIPELLEKEDDSD